MNPFKQMLDAAEADVLKLEALATRAENAVTRIFAAKALFSSSATMTDTGAAAADQAATETTDTTDATDDTVAETEDVASPAAGTATVAVAENPQTAAAS